MNKFNEREQAYENKFKKDQEFDFRADARRNKLLGLWLAEQFGLTGDNADSYAQDVIASDFEEPGDEDVFRKIKGDVEKYSVDISDYLLRKKMEELLVEARQQLRSETD